MVWNVPHGLACFRLFSGVKKFDCFHMSHRRLVVVTFVPLHRKSTKSEGTAPDESPWCKKSKLKMPRSADEGSASLVEWVETQIATTIGFNHFRRLRVRPLCKWNRTGDRSASDFILRALSLHTLMVIFHD